MLSVFKSDSVTDPGEDEGEEVELLDIAALSVDNISSAGLNSRGG